MVKASKTLPQECREVGVVPADAAGLCLCTLNFNLKGGQPGKMGAHSLAVVRLPRVIDAANQTMLFSRHFASRSNSV